MDLLTRIQILKDAEQITEETKQGMIKVIEMFDREYSIKLTEENGAMLITHLCIAIERIKKNEMVNKIDSMLYEEIKNSDFFKISLQALGKMERELGITIPEIEQQFILMHLCVLFDRI